MFMSPGSRSKSRSASITPTGSILTGPPTIKDNWVWGGTNGTPALFKVTTKGGNSYGGINCVSQTLPEFGMNIGMYSNVGSNNASGAYKVALAAWMIGGAGAGNTYPLNTVVQVNSGFNKLAVAAEFDLNNNSGNNYSFTTLGTGADVHGTAIVSGGSNDISAAVWIVGVGSGKFGNGIAITTALSTIDSANSAFQATSGGYNFIRALGTWTNGVNLFGATITNGDGTAFISPNNVGFGAANSAGSATMLVAKVDTANKIQYGSSTITIQHNFNVNPASANAAIQTVNAHATAGDVVEVLAGGSSGTADTSTTYISFNDPTNTAQCGAVIRADAAGVRHVSYATTSDEHMKRILGPADDAVDRVMEINVVKYTGKDYVGPDYHIGYVAQNLHTVMPEAVTPGTSVRPWMADYGRVSPLHTAGIQNHELRLRKLEKLLNGVSCL